MNQFERSEKDDDLNQFFILFDHFYVRDFEKMEIYYSSLSLRHNKISSIQVQ